MEYMQWICILTLSGTFGIPVEQMSQIKDKSTRQLHNPTSTFNWTHCDKIGSPFNISYLNIQPDPIILGQNIDLSFDAMLNKPVGNGSAVELDADIKMLIGGRYEEICYFVGDKFCYRPNICAEPRIHCPIPNKRYSGTMTFRPPKPPFLISGLFEAIVVLREKGKDLVCVKLRFSIQS